MVKARREQELGVQNYVVTEADLVAFQGDKEYNDYIYKESDIARFKQELERVSEKQRDEMKQNEDLVPPESEEKVGIEIIKEQIIDLNDKFDFLINLMIKNQKIGVIKNPEGKEPDFFINNDQPAEAIAAEVLQDQQALH